MRRRASRLFRAVAVALFAAAVAPSASAGPPGAADAVSPGQTAAGPRLLDVPYLPQSEDLCGGAAAAMVMRYWGARGVYAEDFAPLVDPAARGIRTDALVKALAGRSWTTIVEDGSAGRAREQIDRGRPVIALIEDRPRTYHYVVIVAWAAGSVVVHDPARAPLRTLNDAAFDSAWQRAGRWMLVLLPPARLEDRATRTEDALAAAAAPASCAALVDAGIATANAGDRTAAADTLQRAARACPQSSAPWRELAGLDAAAKNWAAAAGHAARAAALDRTDEYAWNLLATARYVTRDDRGALRAWNHAGMPRVDLVNVQGLARTRYRVAFDTAGLPPGTLLTPGRLRLGERRLDDVPAFAAARLTYRPLEGGRADVDAAVVERDFVPHGYPALIGFGATAATERTIAASVSSPTGAGDRLSGSWRWWRHRPAVSVAYAALAPAAIGGVWRVDAARDTETFGVTGRQETRTRAGLTFGKWLAAGVRVEATVGGESWAADRTATDLTATDHTDLLTTDHTDLATADPDPHPARRVWRTAMVGGSMQVWPVADRLVVRAGGAAWPGGGTSFFRASIDGAWRSSAATAGQVWLARAGAQIAGDRAPASLWPGADTGHARDVLLRAHSLLHDGIITGGVFGRRLVSGGAEWRRWSRPSMWLVRVAPAAFVDVARATRGLATSDTRVQVDAGAGLRFSLAGAGMLRVDVAHGLRDGRTALSVAWGQISIF